MTTKKHPYEATQTILERILETVESIDHNVEDLREQLSDHFDHAAYASWRDGPYGWNHGHD